MKSDAHPVAAVAVDRPDSSRSTVFRAKGGCTDQRPTLAVSPGNERVVDLASAACVPVLR